MQMNERQILRALHAALDELPDNASENDSRFAVETANSAISTMLSAGEPFNKERTFLDKARGIVETLEAFIEHRKAEQWSENTTYFCTHCPLESLSPEMAGEAIH